MNMLFFLEFRCVLLFCRQGGSVTISSQNVKLMVQREGLKTASS